MNASAHDIIERYTTAYQQLYQRYPKQVQVLSEEWVIANDARMRVTELAHLTAQLEQEYQSRLPQRRSMVMRLLNWFRQ